jgi:two-component system, NarL family, sensor histidine kinase DesK
MNTTLPNRLRWHRIWQVAGPVFGAAWLAAPTLAFALSDPSVWQVVLVAACIPAFAALFLSTVMSTERPIAVPVLAMLAIAVALTLAIDQGFGWLFLWAGSAAGVRLESPNNVKAVLAITALAAATMALTGDGAAFWGITAAVFATSALWVLIGGLLRANAALREARAELAERAVADERLRFARDLHDLLGHSLSLIALKAELAGKLLPARTADAQAEVEQIRELTRSALTQVREAVDGYRQPTLPSELAGAKVALEAAGIALRVDAPDAPLDPEVEAVLAWAVREGATNAIRHSGARHAEITVRPGLLEIADDGTGAPRVERGGHGLTGLRERVQSIGGTVEAGVGPAGGFRLVVRVPAT